MLCSFSYKAFELAIRTLSGGIVTSIKDVFAHKALSVNGAFGKMCLFAMV